MRHRDPRTGRFARQAILPPARPDPLIFPTYHSPRWRLRIFDRRWPWRRSVEEVMDDALGAGEARVDPETRRPYLVVPAMVQRDPPLMAARPDFADHAESGWRQG